MSHVIYKSLARAPILLAGGEGVWLWDQRGTRYLDTCGGVAVSSLGHCHPRIVAALERHASSLSWAHAGSFTTPSAEELASTLVTASRGLAKAQFLSGGSEAMELSLKIAYQYHCERGQPERTIVVSRRQSYHGSTFASLRISGNRQRRSIFEPMLGRPVLVSPCYAYRDQQVGESDAAYATRLGLELDAAINELGAGRVSAFVAETVVGSTSGAVPAVPGYLKEIEAVCDRHGVLLILDEIMAGMGRTGHIYAYAEDDITPDIVAIGKGLAAGYQPISGVLVSERVHLALANGSGVLQNGQTHVNHPLACAIALEVQRTIAADDLLTNVRARGEQLRSSLRARLADFECVGDVRGRGLLVGVEFVTDRTTKQPYPGGARFAAALKAEGLRRNVLLYPGYGTVDGERGNHVLFAPPFIVTESEIEQMVYRFADVVAACV